MLLSALQPDAVYFHKNYDFDPKTVFTVGQAMYETGTIVWSIGLLIRNINMHAVLRQYSKFILKFQHYFGVYV